MNNQKPIGIFDSGIGGLTVLNELTKILPNENFIYYADTKHLPYGDKSKEEIISYSKYIVEYFIKNDVKAIIIACGTASALAFETLKSDYDIPIFNVIDATVKSLCSNNIGILATLASVSSDVWDNKILVKLPNANVTKVACPKLVPIAESGLVNTTESIEIIEEYLKPIKKQNVDTLILGCTHYPLFLPIIKNILNSSINIINMGTPLARDFKNFLESNNLTATKNEIGKITYIVSGDENKFLESKKVFRKLIRKTFYLRYFVSSHALAAELPFLVVSAKFIRQDESKTTTGLIPLEEELSEEAE